MAIDPTKMGLKPVDVFFGLRNKDTVTTVADVTSSLQSLSFNFETVALDGTVVPYYAWFNVGAAGIDPATAGRTGAEVAFAADASATVIATALAAVLDALPLVSSKSSGAVVTIRNQAMGAMTAATEVDSTFTFASVTVGAKEDLGSLDGAPDFSPAFSFVDVKADQLGDTLIDQIQNGVNLEVTMSLLEIDADKWATIVGNIAGDKYTPSGGTELVGVGTSKRFNNMKQFSRELLLKPSNSADDLGNLTIYGAFPDLTSITFSGSELHKMEVTFKAFVDTAVNDAINLYSYGDSAQDIDA